MTGITLAAMEKAREGCLRGSARAAQEVRAVRAASPRAASAALPVDQRRPTPPRLPPPRL
jgi:hypothetical protein